MECLDEETILGFCRSGLAGLTADARTRAEEHIATCDECRALVSAVVRSLFAEMPRPPVGVETVDARDVKGAGGARADDDDEDARADRKPRPMLRGRIDPAMAPTTPIGGAGFDDDVRPPVSPVKPGQILAGKFEVERVLGVGGMGIVVAARHMQLGQRVALKFLLPVACEVPGAVARFLREGKAAARITSEHVARVMDTGVLEGGAPYLVMEYLEGSDLGEVVQKRGRIETDAAVEYVLQACEAIVEAHELGIVHRDLKPANLFLSQRADGSPLVKVLDFGISKVEGSGSRSQLTSASVLMGSPRYMSPEQMLSAKDVDARTDVWALGVILFELTTGKSVWHADTMQGLCALIASAPAPLLRTLAPDAPAILEEVVARCLAKSADDRMASVADLALALEPIAPDTARTSIDRILRVARKDRAVTTGPRKMPRVSSPVEVKATDAPPGSSRVGTWLAMAVGALLVVGIAFNYGRDPQPRTPIESGPAVGLPPGAPPTPARASTEPSAPSSAANERAAVLGASSASSASSGSVPSSPIDPPAASITSGALGAGAPVRSAGRRTTATPPAISAAPVPPAASPPAASPLASAKVEPSPSPSPSPVPSGSNRALTDRK